MHVNKEIRYTHNIYVEKGKRSSGERSRRSSKWSPTFTFQLCSHFPRRLPARTETRRMTKESKTFNSGAPLLHRSSLLFKTQQMMRSHVFPLWSLLYQSWPTAIEHVVKCTCVLLTITLFKCIKCSTIPTESKRSWARSSDTGWASVYLRDCHHPIRSSGWERNCAEQHRMECSIIRRSTGLLHLTRKRNPWPKVETHFDQSTSTKWLHTPRII